MSSLAEIFGAPFNWCDRRCERCPLAEQCTVRRRELQRRWVVEARDGDPDDMAVVMSDVNQLMETVLVELRRLAAEERIDLDAPLKGRPVSLDAERLRRKGLAMMTAAKGLAPTEEANELMKTVLTVATKSARIAANLDVGDARSSDAWVADVVANLLLLETSKKSVRDALSRMTNAPELRELGEALTDIDRILDPLISQVDAQLRKVLAGLIARRAAPSPFCTVEAAATRDVRAQREADS